jgi:creatinine amidohydrolase
MIVESKEYPMTEPEIRLERLRSTEIRERIEDGWTTVLFACGAVEQHGPHLPIFMDTEFGSRMAVEVAQRLGRVLVAPTIRVGFSEHHMAFSGTISLRQETFEAIVTDYVTSLARHGFERILILPTHGGNFAPLIEMEGRLQEASGESVVASYTDLIGLIELFRNEAEAELGLGDRIGGHADMAETSIMLNLHPDLVRLDLAEAGFQTELSEAVVERIIRDGLDSVTPNGILGDARGATADLGTRLIAAFATEVANFFQSG